MDQDKQIVKRQSSSPSKFLDLLAITENVQDQEFVMPPLKKTKLSDVPIFKTRSSPNGLYNLVKQLSEEQKEAVRAIGFGSLLLLNISKCPVQFSRSIVSLFNYRRRAIILDSGVEIVIKEEDVQCILNIPRGEIKVVESIGVESDEPEYKQMLRAWRRRWGIVEDKGSPLTNAMPQRMLMNTVGDDNFKRDFVVYVVSSFLWNSQNTACRFKILKSLQDVSKIRDLNWCKFTLDGLVDSSMKWHSKKKSYFHGPLTFLLLCYLDRVKEHGLQQNIPRRFPILGCWDDNSLYERVAYESKHGGFGQGTAIARIRINKKKDNVNARNHINVEEEQHSIDLPQKAQFDETIPVTSNIINVLESISDAFNVLSKGAQQLKDLNIDAVPILVAGIQPFADLIKQNATIRIAFQICFEKENINLNDTTTPSPSPHSTHIDVPPPPGFIFKVES